MMMVLAFNVSNEQERTTRVARIVAAVTVEFKGAGSLRFYRRINSEIGRRIGCNGQSYSRGVGIS